MTQTIDPQSAPRRRHVVICGSMSALSDMERIAEHLRNAGCDVSTPVAEEEGLDWAVLPLAEAVSAKRAFLTDYFEVIAKADVVLIANYEKHSVQGYIGANTLMEAACGHAHRKPVFFLFPIGDQSCRLEALAISAGILDGNANHLVDTLRS